MARPPSFVLSACASSLGVVALVLAAAATGGAGCDEGYGPEAAAGSPPVTVRSPSFVDSGISYPVPLDAAVACDRPFAPTVSEGSCAKNAGMRVTCNPVTNGGCLPGTVCDFSVSLGEFRCLTPGKAPLCGPCGEGPEGPTCAAGTTCRGGLGVCTRFCCNDADCGDGGNCIPQSPSPIGICEAVSVSRLATFGVGEHGGGPRPSARALCNLPPQGPSPGACVRIGGEAFCNPVTNAGCGEGTTCDVVPGGFRCLPLRLPLAEAGGAGGAAGEGGASGAGSAGEGGASGAGNGGASGAGDGGASGAGNGGAGNSGAAGTGGSAGPLAPGTLCGTCDASDAGGNSCQAGLHCVNGACARFCCWDDDCGGAECDQTFFGTLGVGVCISASAAADAKPPAEPPQDPGP